MREVAPFLDPLDDGADGLARSAQNREPWSANQTLHHDTKSDAVGLLYGRVAVLDGVPQAKGLLPIQRAELQLQAILKMPTIRRAFGVDDGNPGKLDRLTREAHLGNHSSCRVDVLTVFFGKYRVGLLMSTIGIVAAAVLETVLASTERPRVIARLRARAATARLTVTGEISRVIARTNARLR